MNESHPLHLYNIESVIYAPNVVLQSFLYTSILLFSLFHLLITFYKLYLV